MAPMAAFIQRRTSETLATERVATKMEKKLKWQKVGADAKHVTKSQYHRKAVQIRHQALRHQTKSMTLKPTNVSQKTTSILEAIVDALKKPRNARQRQEDRANRTNYTATPNPSPTRPTNVAEARTSRRTTDLKCYVQLTIPFATHWTCLADKSSKYDDHVPNASIGVQKD